MKRIFFCYLNGLSELYRRSNDPDIYVLGIVIFMQICFLFTLRVIFDFHIPTSDELGNKWIVRMIESAVLVAINRYLFGIRESVYSEHPPLSKRTTIWVTLIYFAFTIGFVFYSSIN